MDPPDSAFLSIKGKVVSFEMDYFGKHEAKAIVRGNDGQQYGIWMGAKGQYGTNWVTISALSPGPMGGALSGQVLIDRFAEIHLNRGYITFYVDQVVGNIGRQLKGMVSHEVGGKFELGIRVIHRRRR